MAYELKVVLNRNDGLEHKELYTKIVSKIEKNLFRYFS